MKSIRRFGLFFLLMLLSCGVTNSQDADVPLLYEIRLNEAVHDIAWSPDGALIAVGSDAGLSIYDDSLTLMSRPQETLNVVSLSWSPDSRFLAAAVDDHIDTVQIWRQSAQATFSLEHFIPYATPDEAERSITATSIKWSPDGRKLAVLSEAWECCSIAYYGSIEVWDTRSWSFLSTSLERFFFTNDYIGSPYPRRPSSYDIAWSSDSRLIAATGRWNCRENEYPCENPLGSGYGGIFLVDAATGAIAGAVATRGLFGAQSLAWDGEHPLATGDESGIELRSPSTLESLGAFDNPSFARGGIAFPTNPSGVYPLIWSPTDPRLFFPSYGITILDVEANTCQKIDAPEQPSSRETAIDILFDASRLVGSFRFEDDTSTIQIWQIPPRGEGAEPC